MDLDVERGDDEQTFSTKNPVPISTSTVELEASSPGTYSDGVRGTRRGVPVEFHSFVRVILQ